MQKSLKHYVSIDSPPCTFFAKASVNHQNHRQPRLLPFYFGCKEKNPHRTRPTIQEYSDLRDISQEILSKFSPRTHQFVMIGRSPTPIHALMRQIKGVRVHSLRIPSGFGRINQASPSEREQRLKFQANQAMEQLLRELDASRKYIVLLDFCLTGTTLQAVFQGVYERIEQQNLGWHVLALALANDRLSDNFRLELIPKERLSMIDLNPYRTLRKNLFSERYDNQAEYVLDSKGQLYAHRGVFYRLSHHLRECADSDRYLVERTHTVCGIIGIQS